MKFLNKKEQVFDIQLTPYGKHKLSAGNFTPMYYAFFDDNVIYDLQYAGGAEEQSSTHRRIKQETQYLESQTLFRQVLSGAVTQGGILQETIYEQEQNLLTSDGFIGDAKLLSKETDVAPAWKFITMQNNITSSALEDTKNNSKVPQINITASYILQSRDPADLNLREENVRQINSRTATFSDGRLIELEMNDPLIYLEELNTELLTDNFDIEVFQVTRGTSDDDFRQLFFKTKAPQVVNGMLMSPQPILNDSLLTTGSVEYYFSIAKDSEVDSELACKYVNQFNSENYLIDLDFDCSDANGEDVYFDIYGRVTESEICPD